MADNGKIFAQDFTRISTVAANDKVLIQDYSDGVVKYATTSQILSYMSANGNYQPLLTLSILSNGNIRIGNLAGTTKDFMPATPSGDPMHYAYEAAGAVWNASTGFWEMYDMTDVTNEQMRAAYFRGAWNPNDIAPFERPSVVAFSNVRFTLARTGAYNAALTDGNSWAKLNTSLEFVNLTFDKKATTYSNSQAVFSTAKNAFYNCTSLRRIYGMMIIYDATDLTDIFYNCTSLTTATIYGIKANIDLHYSPLDVASATYLIQNASSSATFSVTFKASMRATYEANTDFVAAKDAKTNITINYL